MQNSSRIDVERPDSPVSGHRLTDLEEFCTRAWRATAAAGRGIRWYMSNLMGDSAYATYVAHHRGHHPDEPVPTEREFWRERMDDQDRNPGARCC